MSTDASMACKHVAEVRQSWRATFQKPMLLENLEMSEGDESCSCFIILSSHADFSPDALRRSVLDLAFTRCP